MLTYDRIIAVQLLRKGGGIGQKLKLSTKSSRLHVLCNFAGGIPRLFHLIRHAAQLKWQCWPSFTFYSSSMIDVISIKIFRQNNNCSSLFQYFPFDFPLRQKSKSLIKLLNESRSLINQAPNVCSFQGLMF